ncbi:MAG: hypothetical protein ACN4E6_00570 [Qipengyuania pacifica]
MNRNFKTMLTGAAVALGLVSTAALAQQADRAPQDAGSHMNMDSEAGAEETMPRGEMMEMMQDPEMRRKMMANCKAMMERMEAMSASQDMSASRDMPASSQDER